MSVTSGFFNSVNGDRRYSAEQMSSLFDGIINDGVFASIGTAFEVKAKSGKTVTVGLGRAWFNSIWVDNDAILSITANDAEILLSRYDAIVIEINHTSAVRAGTIKYIKGTASSNPQKPTMANTNEIHQYPLAYIYRPAGSTEITQSNITNCVGTSSCPYITGILQVQNIDKNVAQWEAQFNEWFDRMQDQLSEDAVGNLQRQIDEMGGQLGKIKYKEIFVDADAFSSNIDAIKSEWETFDLDSIYLVRLSRGSHRIAIVQKYSKSHDYGAVMIFGYSSNDVELHTLSAGNWDVRVLATKSDLANYLPLSGGTLSGDITLSNAKPFNSINIENGRRKISLHLSATDKMGLWDGGKDEWIIYSDTDGHVRTPSHLTAGGMTADGYIYQNSFNNQLIMGAQNESYCHFTSSNHPFYFDKDILVNGSKVLTEAGGTLTGELFIDDKRVAVCDLPAIIMTVNGFEAKYGKDSIPSDWGMVTMQGYSRPGTYSGDTYYHVVNHEGKSFNGRQLNNATTIAWNRNLTTDDFVVTGSVNEATLTINLD